MALTWNDLPDFDAVQKTLDDQSDTKARLKVAKLELEIYQAKMMQRGPRAAYVKLIGVDEESAAHLAALLQKVVDLEIQLDGLDAEVAFNNYRRDIIKSLSFSNKM